MRPLRHSTNVTLDGCIDHRAGIPDEELHRRAAAHLERADALIFGRVTYEMMESAWRAPAETGVLPDWMQGWMLPFARTIHAKKKYVVSRTLRQVDWNAELLEGDLEQAVRRLKAEPGEGLFVAGLRLAQALTEWRLIDEYELVVHPRIIGTGPTLFAGLARPVDLTLVNHVPYASGAMALRYRLAEPA